MDEQQLSYLDYSRINLINTIRVLYGEEASLEFFRTLIRLDSQRNEVTIVEDDERGNDGRF